MSRLHYTQALSEMIAIPTKQLNVKIDAGLTLRRKNLRHFLYITVEMVGSRPITDADKAKLLERALQQRVYEQQRYHKNAEHRKELARQYYAKRKVAKLAAETPAAATA
jgi:hypothetical protein